MERILFIDDLFNPDPPKDIVNPDMKREALKKIVQALLKKEYEIGLKYLPEFVKCQPKDCGISVYNTTRFSNGDEIVTFDYPSDDLQREHSGTNMFFSTDGAYRYFKRFTSDDELERLEALTRLGEIEAVIMDIHMPPGTCLPKEYKRARVDDKNAGFWLTHFLGKQVAAQNPNALMPVLMLTDFGPGGILEDQTNIKYMTVSKNRSLDGLLYTLETLVKVRVR